MVARCRPKRAAYSSRSVSSRGLFKGGGVMSVRTMPSMPMWKTALEKRASTVSSSIPNALLISSAGVVYWKKTEKRPYWMRP